MADYGTHLYFFNLLALSVIGLPAFYCLTSESARQWWMAIMGIYLLYFIAPRLVVVYLAFWLLVWFAHRYAFREVPADAPRLQERRILAIFAIPLIVAPMLLWKVRGEQFIFELTKPSNAALKFLSTKLWEIDMVHNVVAPLGLSFATFRAIDLIIKTYLGKIENLSLREVFFFGFFAPVQIVGPVIEYEETAKRFSITPTEFMAGLLRIAIGALKTFLLAGVLQSTTEIFSDPYRFPVWRLWLELVGYSWFFYLNFSGYTDIVLGSAALYGYKLKENFNFPFFKQNIQQFWNSWNISLSRWAQRNVYVPAGGYRPKNQYFALFLTIMTIALWHAIDIPMVLFGLYHFILLTVHRLFLKHRDTKETPARLLRISYTAITYFCVLLGFPLIFQTKEQLWPFYSALLGLPHV